MFVGSERVICWGRRFWSNVCSGPIFGVNTVPAQPVHVAMCNAAYQCVHRCACATACYVGVVTDIIREMKCVLKRCTMWEGGVMRQGMHVPVRMHLRVEGSRHTISW